MSDESTKPTEEPKPIAPEPPKPQESTVDTFNQSIEKTEAGFEKAEKFVKLVAENLRYGSWTKRFVTIGGVAFLAFNPFTVGKVGEVFGVRELPQWYWTSFYGGMGGIAVGAVGAAIVTLPKRTLEAMPERQAIKGLRSFEFKDAEIFKRLERGRDVQDCLDAIDTEDLRLFLLMGESGVGKSSLLQAGLMPNFGRVGMVGCYVKLGDRDPIVVIRKALGGSEGEDFVGMLRSAVAKNGKPMVLILDQFEQFFVQFKDEARSVFIAALKDWYESDVAVKILIGIRSDLYDRTTEIHEALNYSLRREQVNRLEKFAPEQATEVLRVIAETEKWSFNEAFVLEMARDQLAGLDGKVAPVEVQVLAQMVSREPSEDNRRLDKTSFQKLGGVDGLLGRSLQRSLDAIPGKSDRDRALQVLLALTDLDRNVRSGAFSILQLQGMTEKVHGSPSEVEAAVGWLSESRLISPGDGDGAVMVYELAHERLIPALRVVANRELSDVNKANMLLDRRVNEWLGSGKNRRYLFSLKELGLLRKQRGFLEWEQQRSQKEALVKNSWNRSRWGLGAIGMPLGMGLAFVIWSNTPPGQIQWTRWDLRTLGNMRFLEDPMGHPGDNLTTASNLDMIAGVSHQPFPNLWIKWFALERYDLPEMRRTIQMTSKLKNRDSAKQLLRQIELVTDNFPNEEKAELLSQLSAVWVDFQEVNRARKLLDAANTAIPSIKNESYQSNVLLSIAEASGKLGDTEKGKQVLEKALDVTKPIKDELYQSNVLVSIAEAYGKLGDAEKGKQVLEKALDVTKSIKDESYQSYGLLRSIVEASSKLGDAEKEKQVLEKALDVTKSIKDKSYQRSALPFIAEAYGKLGDSEKGNQILEKALNIITTEGEYFESDALSYIAEAYGKLGDAEKGKQVLEKALDNRSYSIAEAYGKLGDAEKGKQVLEKALNIITSTEDKFYQSNALRYIAEAYGKLGDAEKGKQVLEKALDATKSVIKTDGEMIIQQGEELNFIVEVSGKLGDAEKGKQVLEKALDVTKSIKGELYQSNVLVSIAEASGKLGDAEKGKQVLEKALDVTKSIKDEALQSSALHSIVKSYLELGDRDRGLKILNDITRKSTSNTSSKTRKVISNLHAEFGNWGEALHFARQCSGSDKINALATILNVHAEQKHPEFKELRIENEKERRRFGTTIRP